LKERRQRLADPTPKKKTGKKAKKPKKYKKPKPALAKKSTEEEETIFRSILQNYATSFAPNQTQPLSTNSILFPKKTKVRKSFKEFKILSAFA
jgi:hypothetical protein